MKFVIKNRRTAAVIFECEAESVRRAVEMAVSKEISLRDADLKDTNLSDANLSRADMSRADMSYADLSDADLSGTDLSRADLSYADMSYADLSHAELSYANLRRADLSRAALSYANLSYANLSRADLSSANLHDVDLNSANLSDADLNRVKRDLFNKLSPAKAEVVGLYKSLMDGRVDGSAYEGECACFIGTIANIRKEKYTKLRIKLRPNSSSPVERWFTGIRKGDSPENNPVCALTANWIREYAKENAIALPLRQVTWGEI